MAAAIAGKSSPTITAEALVERAAAAYLGFDTKVRSPGPACSIPLSLVISVSGEPFSRRRSRAEAMADSFMGMVEERFNRTPVSCSGWVIGISKALANLIAGQGGSRADSSWIWGIVVDPAWDAGRRLREEARWASPARDSRGGCLHARLLFEHRN